MLQRWSPTLLFIINTVIIIGVMCWSGTVREKTLYDRFLVSLEGSTLPVSDIKESMNFYTQILNLSPLSTNTSGVTLPDGRAIYFKEKQKPQIQQFVDQFLDRDNIIALRVKNSLEKLHSEIVTRSKHPAQSLTPETFVTAISPKHTSSIQEHSWGKSFSVSDPDGNKIIFLKPKTKKTVVEPSTWLNQSTES